MPCCTPILLAATSSLTVLRTAPYDGAPLVDVVHHTAWLRRPRKAEARLCIRHEAHVARIDATVNEERVPEPHCDVGQLHVRSQQPSGLHVGYRRLHHFSVARSVVPVSRPPRQPGCWKWTSRTPLARTGGAAGASEGGLRGSVVFPLSRPSRRRPVCRAVAPPSGYFEHAGQQSNLAAAELKRFWAAQRVLEEDEHATSGCNTACACAGACSACVHVMWMVQRALGGLQTLYM